MTITVLIADDQTLVRSGLRAIIESEPGMEVVGEAADGAEAVEAVRRLRPDVALMDIRMPRLDGVAATRALLRGAAPVPTRVVMLTTFHTDEYVTEAAAGRGVRIPAEGGHRGPARRCGARCRRRRGDARALGHPPPARADGRGLDPVARRCQRDQELVVSSGGRRAAPGRTRPVERRDQCEALPRGDHREEPRAEHAGETGRPRSPAGRRRRIRLGTGPAGWSAARRVWMNSRGSGFVSPPGGGACTFCPVYPVQARAEASPLGPGPDSVRLDQIR